MENAPASPSGLRHVGPWSRRLDWPLLLVMLAAALLRLSHLGYSHFQGDEIKALYPRDAAFPGFLLAQRKGPTQFLVTLVTGWLTGGYEEWVTRLPFALASLMAVYIVYRLIRDEFGRFPALLAAALLAGNGLVVALGRIVQYQSFLLLFLVRTAYWMLQWLRDGRATALYLGIGCYALALLTHYDAMAFAPTLGVILVIGLRRHAGAGSSQTRRLVTAVGIAALVLGTFYVPYVLQPGFPAVKEYLLSRIASGAGMQTFPATLALLGLYLHPFYLAVAIPLLACGIAHVLVRRRTVARVIVLFWFLSVFSVYMFLGGDPRSHVYNYFVPGLILVAVGIAGLIEPVRNLPVRKALQIGAWALIISSGAMTYYMLVDHTVEHPWAPKRLLGRPLPNVETGVVEGVFGFPYQRGLDQVGRMFQTGRLRGTFDSNERDVMADYYFHSRRSSPPDYYVYVQRPLSLNRDLPAYVKAGYDRVAEITVRGTRTIEVYERRGRSQ